MIYTVTFNPAIDRYLDINTLEISKTNYYKNSNDVFGGKAINVAKIISQFTDCTLVTKKDEANSEFINSEVSNLKSTLVLAKNVRINYKLNNNGLITEINQEVIREVKSSIKIIDYLRENITNDDIVVFAGTLCKEEINLIKEFRDSFNNLKIVIDSSSITLEDLKYIKPFLFKPNEEEIELLIGREKISKAVDILLSFGLEHIVISKGSEGSSYYSKEKKYCVSIAPGKVVNTVGAGDSFVGGFLVGIANSMKIEETLKFASSCGCASAYSDGIAEKKLILKIKENISVCEF